MPRNTALLFPGPGACLPGVVGSIAAENSAVRELVDVVDEVSVRYQWGELSPWLTGSADHGETDALRRPEVLWLGFFATSLAVFEVMRAEKFGFTVLAGHSGGEITALVAAGSLGVEDAARLHCERIKVLADTTSEPCGMAAVAMSADRLAHLCSATGDWSLAVAVDNAPRQSVVSGHAEAVALVEKLAGVLGAKATRLSMKGAFHNPVSAAAAANFGKTLDDISVRSPTYPVYSPLLGRLLADVADVREMLARHLVRPVRFRDALTTLYGQGIDRFVECGARQVLTDLVHECLPAAALTLAPLTRRTDLATLRHSLREANFTRTPHVNEIAEVQVAADERDEQPTPRLPQDDALLTELRQVYSNFLGYPIDVLTDDVELEADLGVSSIKQVQIFTQLLDRYDLPTPPSELRVATFRTLPLVASLLRDLDER